MRSSRAASSLKTSSMTSRGVALAAALVFSLALPLWGCDSATTDEPGTVPVDTGETNADEGTDAPASEESPSEEPVDENEPVSTPSDQWRKGEAPYLYQIDSQYANAVYSGGSFAKQGCGPTALSVAYIYLTGNTDKGPLEMAQFATENGYSTDQNGSTWTLISEGAGKLGLTSTAIGTDATLITQALQSGNVVICVMAPGTFTQVGHFIALVGLDADGKAIVRDSNSVERSHQTWDLSLICDEAEAVWSVGAAS